MICTEFILLQNIYLIHFVTKWFLPNSFCYKVILPNSFCYKMICTEFILLQNDFYRIHFVTKWLCTEFILYYKMFFFCGRNTFRTELIFILCTEL